MIYCDNCRSLNDWPGGWMRSHGPCEACGEVASCHDMPERYLPAGALERRVVVAVRVRDGGHEG